MVLVVSKENVYMSSSYIYTENALGLDTYLKQLDTWLVDEAIITLLWILSYKIHKFADT